MTYTWLNNPSQSPNIMWNTPRITESFILKLLMKVSLLDEMAHTYNKKETMYCKLDTLDAMWLYMYYYNMLMTLS